MNDLLVIVVVLFLAFQVYILMMTPKFWEKMKFVFLFSLSQPSFSLHSLPLALAFLSPSCSYCSSPTHSLSVSSHPLSLSSLLSSFITSDISMDTTTPLQCCYGGQRGEKGKMENNQHKRRKETWEEEEEKKKTKLRVVL